MSRSKTGTRTRGWGPRAQGWGQKVRGWGLGTGGWGFVIFTTIVASGLPGAARGTEDSNTREDLTIALHIYDYAQVEPQELAQAQEEAARVLARIGIAAHWLNCPVPGREPQSNEACHSTAGARELALRILPQAMAERMARDKGSLGFAQHSADGTPGYVANVFYHRVESLSVELNSSRAVILGYALAHEIGHLLLGTTSHSPHGIMRAHWTEREMLSASAGRFGFLPGQGERIRGQVRERLAAMPGEAPIQTSQAAIR